MNKKKEKAPAVTPPKPDKNHQNGHPSGKGNGKIATETRTPETLGLAENPVLTINAQYLKDLSFENPMAPGIFQASPQSPKIGVDVDVKASLLDSDNANIHEVTLSLSIVARLETQTVFICEAVYGGVFTLDQLPQTLIQPVLMVECPRLLFPFLRAIISQTTSQGGFPPLMINPIDFHRLYKNKMEQNS